MNCARFGCKEVGCENVCGKCFVEMYCSTECQKLDWKIHRLICPYMKNNKLLNVDEVLS